MTPDACKHQVYSSHSCQCVNNKTHNRASSWSKLTDSVFTPIDQLEPSISTNMSSRAGSHSTRVSPRKFSEKIALLNKKEREANAKFEEIIKEVHATKGKPSHREPLAPGNSNSVLYPDNDLSSLTEAELQFQLSNSTNYKAAHADSLEEIEKVYENLIKSVGQYEDNENHNQHGQIIGVCQQQQQQQSTNNRSTVLHYNESDTSKPTFRSSSASLARQVEPNNTTSTFYHQQTSNIDYRQTYADLKTHQRGREATYNPYEPPSSSFINNFSGHNTLDVCVSTSCIPQQQQHQPPRQHGCSGGRARVVSFGSASRYKYPCVEGYPSEYPVDVGQQQLNNVHHKTAYQGISAQNHHQHPNQYLKEPSGDRSRQKSCSDPQLHVSPGQQQITVSPIGSCKSDNRLTVTAGQAVPFDATTNSIAASGQDCRLQDQNQRSQQQTTTNNIDIYDNNNQAGKIEYPNAQIQDNGDSIKSDCCLVQAQGAGHHHFGVCDTTTGSISRGQLPGIKICAIDDETNQSAKMLPAMDQASDNTSNPSSRDGSLPDISNLKFGSPERGPVYQGQQWPAPDDSGQMVMDGNWSTYAMENVDMDIQIDTSQDAIDYNQSQQLANTQTLTPACPQDGGAFVQPVSRVNTGLSNSDCGFNTSAFHHQQGKLMICASSDLYNNIMRSRSHNNISSMDGHKKSNDYPAGSLHQFAQRHHTSQYCLQTGHQPQVNVRRIAELKSHGTSTSPLDSSSNLNSPQSEMNSPGSSTTEQCEPALMFASNNQQQQQQREFYPALTVAGGSSSTLVPDGMHFQIQHYSQVGVVSGSPEVLNHPQQQGPVSAISANTMFVDQPDCNQPELTTTAYHSSQNSITECSSQAHIDCQQPMAVACQQDLYKRKFTSPSSTTNLSNNDLAMNNENEQSRQT